MIFTREDVYDMILGSGALSYPWYGNHKIVAPAHGENPWLVVLNMEDLKDPDGDFIQVKVTYPAIIAAAIRLIDDTGLSNWGTSAKLGATRQARRQAELLYEEDEDVDFDATTADEVLQVIAYGRVVFA